MSASVDISPFGLVGSITDMPKSLRLNVITMVLKKELERFLEVASTDAECKLETVIILKNTEVCETCKKKHLVSVVGVSHDKSIDEMPEEHAAGIIAEAERFLTDADSH